MGITRKQALKQINGNSRQIESHLAKILGDPHADSLQHWRGEVEGWIEQIEAATKSIGRRTAQQMQQQVAVWRQKLEQSHAEAH